MEKKQTEQGIKAKKTTKTARRAARGRRVPDRYYIAYGSNMDFPQMNMRCPDAVLVGAGKIRNYGLLFKGSGSGNYATIEPAAGAYVPVLVWMISARDEAHLDHYEGCPTFYYKRDLEVEMEDGATVTGMVYIMHEERKIGAPGPHYAAVLYTAYSNFGWDVRPLETAIVSALQANPTEE